MASGADSSAAGGSKDNESEREEVTNTAHLRWDTNGSSECRTVIPRSWKIG